MAWIRTYGDGEAQGALRRSFDAALRRAGRVFGIVRVMGVEPAVLDGSMAHYLAVMHGPGGLDRRRRELLAVVVSLTNHCHY
jgi:alkylhydroperoxidase family enzyme